jgi:hypothetical protein
MDKLSDRKDFAPIREWSDADRHWLISRFPFLSADCLKVALELETLSSSKCRHLNALIEEI